MIGSNAFNYINVLNKAADASWKRNEVISNNIANVDTPGYKRKDVQFESYLMSALLGDNSLDKRVANAKLNTLDATVYTDNATLSYRMDGNNVDIDTESANLAQNQIRYYALLDSMTQEFSRLKTVLSAR
ncbi:flagellar basal body rod protein FlgB [Lachnospiraceae bacterium MD1]|jgi:flagellar basal-body rod protein FlgB|uniref:Flagellar basal body rod protein FlgB n=1 Tax=Variimorphobacter saccharofermentans TaxID=2755051 RepID=A0A839K0M1_9FIRM|nr:flagellar basal body rod protein FlgB [Variimorphobacter saccharofermentans]MBB2182732.1 flagellar basal body rod protein FlgB [Variimorphobacter saccharofermentans]